MATPRKENKESQALVLTADIIASYVSNNMIPAEDLPGMIDQIYKTVRDLEEGQTDSEDLKPAVPVRRSVTADHIVCLEDGKKLKMLRRHLKSKYGMTPEEYRDRWGLPADYPMVAPNYAKKRQELAKKIGLGKKKPAKKKG